MRAVMANVPEHILEWRRKIGADRHDEMWEGVLHMAPVPSRSHQDIVAAVLIWLRRHWAPRSGGRVHFEINVARPGCWPEDYRVPDLVLLSPDRFSIDRDTHFDGGPHVVVEIRSPDDESLEKLPFYADVGVREAWIVDRDSKRPVVFELRGGHAPVSRPHDDAGFVASAVTGVELGAEGGKLVLRLTGDRTTEERIP